MQTGDTYPLSFYLLQSITEIPRRINFANIFTRDE